MSVFPSSSHGGVLLASLKRTGSVMPFAVPPPGVPWTLRSWNGEIQDALAGYGLFSPVFPPDAEAQTGFILLGRQGCEFVFAGTLPRRRDGLIYPRAEILSYVQDLPYVRDASIVETIDGSITPRYALLIFQDQRLTPAAEADLQRELQAELERELGRNLVPDRIEIYPFAPPQVDGEVDHRECANLYESGIFRRKKDSLFFSCLAELQRTLAATRS